MNITFFKSFQAPKISLFDRRRSVLGIDIGSSSVKLVQLRLEKERAVLETYGELAAGPYGAKSVGQAVQLAEEKASEIVRDLIQETGASSRDAIISLPLHHSFVTSVDIPPLRNEDLDTVMQYEARRYIPIPLSEVVMDWWKVPDEEARSEENSIATSPKQQSKVLLVAVPKDIVEKYKKILADVDIKVESFEVETFSIMRSVLGRERSTVLLVDFGAVGTKMTVVERGIVRLSHSFDKGFQGITLALSESLGIGFERAEQLKRETGLSSHMENQGMMKVMIPLLDYLLIEIERFAVGYTKKYNGTISKIYITGGGAGMAGFSDYIVKRFGVEVLVGNPFVRIEYPAFFQPVLKEISPSFATAVGLALRGLG